MANPSGWDSMANYAGSLPDEHWLCVLTRSRDADCLSESNWRVALERLGGEGENVKIFRFRHWACGWWEALCVKRGTDAETEGTEIEKSIKAYPVLSDEDFSALEYETANRVWKDCYTDSERIDYIRENRWRFDFQDFADLRGCVRGEYYCGDVSELLS